MNICKSRKILCSHCNKYGFCACIFCKADEENDNRKGEKNEQK